MKRFISFFLFVFLTGLSFSQIANGDFERWENNQPAGWSADAFLSKDSTKTNAVEMTSLYPEAISYSGKQAMVIRKNTKVSVLVPLDKKYSLLQGHYYLPKTGDECRQQPVFMIASRNKKANTGNNMQHSLYRLENMKGLYPSSKKDWGNFEIDLRAFMENNSDSVATFMIVYTSCDADIFFDNIQLIR